MKKSRRELAINMVIDGYIFINDHITLCFCVNFVPKTGFETT